jgi:hypothetical protein
MARPCGAGLRGGYVVSFHNFKPRAEEVPVTTKIYRVTLKDVRECEFTVRAETEAGAIDAAWKAVTRHDWSGIGSDEEATEIDDDGRDVDIEAGGEQ